MIVLIEDLHWGDKHTFNLIQHLARKAPNNRFLLLCSFRDGEVGLARDGGQSPHQEFLQRASREHLFDTIVLERFNRLHTLELVVSTLGKEVSGEQADRIFGETEGNPFMILEFLKVLEGEGEDVSDTAVAPLSASALIGRRLEGLESRSREILELGAVYGEGMTFEVIANGLEMESEEVLDLIEGLISQRFLKEKDELIVFEHSRVKKAICELIPGDDLKLYHMIVASLLEGKQGEDKRKELSNLANHYFKGEDFNKALEYLLEAAESEYKGHSHHESLAHYNDCLTCLSMIEETEESNTQKLKVLQRKGDVLEELGQFQKAMESYEEALGIAEKKGVIYGLASSYKRMGDITQHFYHWDVVTDYYLRSMHLALKLDDHRELAITFRGMGRMYFLKGEYNRALECYIRYFERPLVQKGADYMRGLLWMGDLYCEIGDLNQALTYYKLAIKAGEEKENQPETALGYVKMSKVLMKLGEAEDARRFCTWAISLSKEIHNVSLYPWIILHYSEQMIELGELDKAKSGLESIANLDYDPLQDELFKGMYHRLMGTLFSKERDFTRAVTHFETGKEILESIKIPFQLAQNQLQYGLLKFQNMDVEGALELVEEANSIFTGINALHLMNHTSSKLRELRFVRDGPAR